MTKIIETKKVQQGPFRINRISNEYCEYGELIISEIEKAPLLPDFSENKPIFIQSDYGGEHNDADFHTYSFLICSDEMLKEFKEQSLAIREKYGLNDPYVEFSFKDLRYGPKKRALTEYLDIANRFIHGVLVTISIDNSIPTLFGADRKDIHEKLTGVLSEEKLGIWKGGEAEKLLRICHPLAILLSLLTRPGQTLFWIGDNDSINTDGANHNFENMRDVLERVLRIYTSNEYRAIFCGRASDIGQAHTAHDLLSLTDLSAGMIQEIAQDCLKNRNIQVNNEKAKLAIWMGTQSDVLQKINLYILQEGAKWRIGNIGLSAKPNQSNVSGDEDQRPCYNSTL